MIVYLYPYLVIPLLSHSLAKSCFKTGVCRSEHTVTLPLRIAMSCLRHADIGNVFCFSFLILQREEGSCYKSLDPEYFVRLFMYSYVVSILISIQSILYSILLTPRARICMITCSCDSYKLLYCKPSRNPDV